MRLTIDVEVDGDKLRPVFTPQGHAGQSWVGEWVSSTQELSNQVAAEFYQWVMVLA